MAKKNKKGSNKPGMKSNYIPDVQKTNVIANDYVEDVPTIVNTKIEHENAGPSVIQEVDASQKDYEPKVKDTKTEKDKQTQREYSQNKPSSPDLVSLQSKLDQKERELDKREKELIIRETNAENEFRLQNEEALKALKSEKEKLERDLAQRMKQISEMEAEKSALRANLIEYEKTERDKVNQAIQDFYDNKKGQVEKEYESMRATFQEALDKVKTTHEDFLDILKQKLEEEIKTTEERQKILNEEISSYEAKLNDLEIRELKIKDDQRRITSLRDEYLAEARELVQSEIDMLKSKLEALQDSLRQKEIIINEFQDRETALGGRTIQEVIDTNEILKSENENLKAELARRPTKELFAQFESLKTALDKINTDYNKQMIDLNELKSQKHRFMMTQAELEQARQAKEISERRREVLSAELDKLNEEVEKLKNLYEKPKERSSRVGIIEKPIHLDLNRDSRSEVNELEWLEGIETKCLESGLLFPRRILHAFHTSLKVSEWSPLTVMAGVSGTGKSELPRLYSRFGGLVFQLLSVQPNWDSPQSLFGFFNSVDNQFNATDLLRAMVQSQNSPGLSEGFDDLLLLVLLDEMNLAYIELYFSDLLSKLETRRGMQDVPSLSIDLGAGLDPYPLKLGRNVLWTGTMNQDETTKSLSDKVIDRGNIISFPRPKLLKRRQRTELASESPLLPLSVWQSWYVDASPFEDDEIGDYKSFLENMNSHLENVGRALGHRVWQSIEAYMCNYPSVLHSTDNDTRKQALKKAFEDQIVQKVMPKLRGIETTGQAKTSCLDPIKKLIADFGLNIGQDFDLACKTGYGQFIWNSAKYLEIED